MAAGSLGSSRRAAVAAGILFAVQPLSSLVAGAIAFQSEAMIAAALLLSYVDQAAALQNRGFVRRGPTPSTRRSSFAHVPSRRSAASTRRALMRRLQARPTRR
jgi:hypothetical protein